MEDMISIHLRKFFKESNQMLKKGFTHLLMVKKLMKLIKNWKEFSNLELKKTKRDKKELKMNKKTKTKMKTPTPQLQSKEKSISH